MTSKKSSGVLQILVAVREGAEARRLRLWVQEQCKEDSLLEVVVAASEAKLNSKKEAKLRPCIDKYFCFFLGIGTTK
eukprot:5623640-Lingulodinium_polyedra.AAC.1